MKFTTSTLFTLFLAPAVVAMMPKNDEAECLVDPIMISPGFYETFSPPLSINNPCVNDLGFAREYRFDPSSGNCPACSSGNTYSNWPAATQDRDDCGDSCPTGGLGGINFCCNVADGSAWRQIKICNTNNFAIWLTTKGGQEEYVWGILRADECKTVDGNGGGGAPDSSPPAISHVNICVSDCTDGGGAMGDPHIFKWGGGYFDYHGECDLTLIDAPEFASGAGLTVQIRTKQIEELGFSYIENAAIRIGDDTFEVAGLGKYFLNGVAEAPMPTQVADFPLTMVKEQGDYDPFKYTIDVGEGIRIVISTVGDYVSIEVKHTGSPIAHQWLGGVTGLMGSFNGTLVARDGVTVMKDIDAFGQEWQVQETETNLFQDKLRFPQHPTKCIAPPATTGRKLRSTISLEDATSACAHVSKEAKEACIFDVQATNEIGMGKVY